MFVLIQFGAFYFFIFICITFCSNRFVVTEIINIFVVQLIDSDSNKISSIMKRLIYLLTIAQFSLICCAQVGFGSSQLFNGSWLFSLTDEAGYKETSFADGEWRTLTLPHDWSIEGTPSRDLASCTGFLPGGIGWYRKHFNSSMKTGDKLYIYFEGVYNRSEVYLNGQLLGKRPNGYISFMYDLTPYLKDGDNVLAVRVDHSKYADSRWYTGSGIYRNVWLVNAPETHLAQWGVSYEAKNISTQSADLDVSVEVEKGKASNLSVKATLLDKDGKQVATATANNAGAAASKCSMKISAPHLWSIDTPYLYILKVELLSAGKVIDESESPIGIRSLRFDPDHGFYLNGHQMKVKGVCIHHDAGVLGAAVPREVWKRRFLSFKQMGVNGIRMSHNVQSPDVYDLADEMGFLVMDEGSDEWEFPKRKWIEGWNRGTPGYDGTFDFFEEWIDRDIADMVRRDRLHPSIFLWSVGNEVDYPNDPYSHPVLDGGNAAISQPMYGGYKKDAPNAERIGLIAQRLAKIIRSLDPSRPVTGAMAGVVMSNQTEYPNAVDVCGYNYTEGRYIEDHKAYPKRIIYGSETSTNLAAWKTVRDNEHIFGHFVWTGYEYLGESGAWPSRGLGTGLIDFSGFLKPRGWYFASLWRTDPMVYAGTQAVRNNNFGGFGDNNNRGGRVNLSTDAQDSWNYQDGQSVRVLCYTNQPFAQVKVNGKVAGEKKERDDQNGIIYWDMPYEAGTLTVEGLDASGKVTASYDVKTYGEATKIATRIDGEPADQVKHLLIEVVDANGNRVLNARQDITVEVISGGRLLGLENSNNGDMSAPKQNHRNANRGRLLAYVERSSTSTPAKVRITTEGMAAVEVEL